MDLQHIWMSSQRCWVLLNWWQIISPGFRWVIVHARSCDPAFHDFFFSQWGKKLNEKESELSSGSVILTTKVNGGCGFIPVSSMRTHRTSWLICGRDIISPSRRSAPWMMSWINARSTWSSCRSRARTWVWGLLFDSFYCLEPRGQNLTAQGYFSTHNSIRLRTYI